jgi:cellulose synthase/poly-beta-1,6-N-acetylglucosamine synthase-like glycosyltransferase
MSTTETILALCFWCSAAGVLHAYLGYPAVISCLSRVFGRAPTPPAVPDAGLPRVALLIAAHNEAGVIEERINNALALVYPRDRFEIVIASDGSDDGTAEVCRRYQDGVRILAFAQRQGKAGTLNAAIQQLDAEVVALSDANTTMDVDSIRRLARWFADPKVGAVCGRLVLTDPRTGRNADGLYWRYETFLKRCEGRLSGPLGANGAIYAIRRSLFTPLPPGTILDDLVIPLVAKLRSGCRIVYDPDALAHEETAPDLGGEFHRRARIGAGGFQALAILWPLLHPRHGWTAFTFWSHKVLRWACPFLMLVALVAAAMLARHPFYRAATIAQVGFYGLCALGAVVPPANRALRLLRVFPLFAGMNLALLIGLVRGVRTRQTGIWGRTARLRDHEATIEGSH